MARAAEFRDRALQALEAIPDGPARDRFREIAVLAVARTS
jgi:geranylgeranyl pyrophosphate synthase